MSKTTSSLFSEEREQIVMEFLKNQGKIRVSEVIDMLNISPSTARLLLQKMQDKGLLTRTHGGAVLSGEGKEPKSEPVSRTISNRDKKLKIALAAAKTIKNGDYISLSSGTTTFLLATMLHDRQDLTVVTDSIDVAYELSREESITVYICGGWIMHRNGACRGKKAESFFQDIRVDKAYCSVDSMDTELGVTSVDFDPRTESAVCRSGKECYILADAQKFHVRPFINKVIGLNEVNHVISDDSLEQSYISALKEAGIQVTIASEL